MPPAEKYSKTTWSKTSLRLGMHVVAGYIVEGGKFSCPVFGNQYHINMDPTEINGILIYIVNYRGHTYFLERYFNENRRRIYYKFGLVEKRKQGPLMRDIISIAEDFSHRYLYNTLGERIISECLKN